MLSLMPSAPEDKATVKAEFYVEDGHLLDRIHHHRWRRGTGLDCCRHHGLMCCHIDTVRLLKVFNPTWYWDTVSNGGQKRRTAQLLISDSCQSCHSPQDTSTVVTCLSCVRRGLDRHTVVKGRLSHSVAKLSHIAVRCACNQPP